MNLSVQFMTMAAMGVMGIWIGISVDTYGRFFYRGGRQRWSPLQIAGDLLFWIIQGLLVFFVLLNVNNGDVRIYIFLALLCGYAAYRSMFQSFYRRFLEQLILGVRFLWRVLKGTVRLFLIRPLQLLIKLVYTIGKMVLSVCGFAFAPIWTPLVWVARLAVPEAFLQKVKNFFVKAAGVWPYVKNIKGRMKSWFKRKD